MALTNFRAHRDKLEPKECKKARATHRLSNIEGGTSCGTEMS
jgi:hypothetical protein